MCIFDTNKCVCLTQMGAGDECVKHKKTLKSALN